MTNREAIKILGQYDVSDLHFYTTEGEEIPFTEWSDAIDMAISALQEPERKPGKWEWLSCTYDRTPCEKRFRCSECHHETIVIGMSDPWDKYCANCGADMRGEQE